MIEGIKKPIDPIKEIALKIWREQISVTTGVAQLQALFEQEKVREAQDIIRCLKDFLRVHPQETVAGAIELLEFREKTRQALKGGE